MHEKYIRMALEQAQQATDGKIQNIVNVHGLQTTQQALQEEVQPSQRAQQSWNSTNNSNQQLMLTQLAAITERLFGEDTGPKKKTPRTD